METKKSKPVKILIQTVMPLDAGRGLKTKAAREHMSVSAYVRRLIYIDLGEKFWKVPKK